MANGILLAHDLTEASGAVSAAAGDLASRLGLSLTAIHAISSEDLKRERARRPPDSAFSDLILDRMQSELASLVASKITHPEQISIAAHVIEGEPSAAIVAYLEENEHEFTFVGVRNRSRVGKLLFGSVPQAILLRSRSKVVTVPIGT